MTLHLCHHEILDFTLYWKNINDYLHVIAIHEKCEILGKSYIMSY